MRRTVLGIALGAIGFLSSVPIAALGAPDPKASPNALPRELAGVRLGDKSTTLTEKCRANGWRCATKKSRKRPSREEVRIELPIGDYKRMRVAVDKGIVVAAKAWYRGQNLSRTSELERTHGKSARGHRGAAVWLSNDGATRLRLHPSNRAIEIVALDKAQETGLITPFQAVKAMATFKSVSGPQKAPTLIPQLKLEDVPAHLTISQGEPSEVGVRVTNMTKQPSDPASLHYRLYFGSSESPLDTQIKQISAIAGANWTRVSFTNNKKLALGAYRAEISLLGATKTVPILVVPTGPDFHIAEMQAPASAQVDDTITLKARVHNIGLAASSAPWAVTFLVNGAPHVVTSQKKLEIAQASDTKKSEWVSVKAKFQPTFVGQNAEVRALISSTEDINLKNNSAVRTVLSKEPPSNFSALEKIPVTIRINTLHLSNNYDDGWGIHDDPILYISGFHSSDPHTWNGENWTYEDLEEGNDAVSVNRTIFSNNDPRRWVMPEQTVGFHVSLWDRDDLDNEDIPKYQDVDPGYQLSWNEIDYVDQVIDFAFLKKHQNQTVPLTYLLSFPPHYMWSPDGAQYELSYSLEIGSATSVAPSSNVVNPALWKGEYEWTLDGHKGTASLAYNGGSANFPHGSFSGTWTDSGKSSPISTREFAGNRWTFVVGEAGVFTGYLIGNPNDLKSLSIAGAAVTDGNEYGFFMKRKP